MDARPALLAVPDPPESPPVAEQGDSVVASAGSAGATATNRLGGSLRWRVAVSLLVLIALVAVAASDPMHRALTSAIDIAEPVLSQRPIAGAILFMALSAVSALLAFVSSGALVPVALDVWGPWGTAALLWSGWTLGGLGVYAVGRALGTPIVARFDRSGRVTRGLSRLGPDLPLWLVALLMVALQSEVSGILLGMSRCPLRRYLTALVAVEAGFAALAVGAGQGLVGRDAGLLIGAGALFIGAGVLAALLLRRRLPPVR